MSKAILPPNEASYSDALLSKSNDLLTAYEVDGDNYLAMNFDFNSNDLLFAMYEADNMNAIFGDSGDGEGCVRLRLIRRRPTGSSPTISRSWTGLLLHG